MRVGAMDAHRMSRRPACVLPGRRLAPVDIMVDAQAPIRLPTRNVFIQLVRDCDLPGSRSR